MKHSQQDVKVLSFGYLFPCKSSHSHLLSFSPLKMPSVSTGLVSFSKHFRGILGGWKGKGRYIDPKKEEEKIMNNANVFMIW